MTQPPATAPSNSFHVPEWIQPMTIGGIIDRSLKIYRSAFGAFFALALLAQIPTFLSSLFPVTRVGRAGMGAAAAYGGMQVVFGLAAMLMGIWALGGIIYLGGEIFLGRRSNFSEASSMGMKLFKSLIWATLLYALLMIAIIGGLGGGGVGIGFLLSKMGIDKLILSVLGAALGIVILYFFLRIFFSRLLYAQALVLEGRRGGATFTRSKQLIRERSEKGFAKNNIMRVSIIFFLVWIIQMILMAVTAGIPMLLTYFVGVGTLGAAGKPIWISALAQAFGSVGQAFAVPISILAMTVFYFDIRIRKEGFDMELRSKAMGTAAAAAP